MIHKFCKKKEVLDERINTKLLARFIICNFYRLFRTMLQRLEKRAYEALYDSYNKWTERGYCPIYAMEVSTRIYEQYHALGGNDVGTELYERLKELPTEALTENKIISDNKYLKEN